MSKLFESFQIKGINFKNRIVMSPMCQYSATDGFASNWHLVHYGSRAVGGTGTIMVESVGVSSEGRISPNDLGIYNPEHVIKLKEITDFIKEQGAVPAIQLGHAGRKASAQIFQEWKGDGTVNEKNGGWQPVAPSPIKFIEEYPEPKELDKEGIGKVVSDFKNATERAIEAGFQVIEIHSAHGYLLHEFLSPLANKRTDEYGGSFENRIRLLLEVVDAVNSVLENKVPLFVRISATDWVKEGAWDLEQSIKLTKLLKEKGVDAMDVSTGAVIPDAIIPVGPGYQLPFASRIKKEVDGILVGTVGMITNAVQAETILLNNEADLIFLGRELLRNPYFPIEAAKELREEIEWPLQYTRGKIK